MIHSRESLFKCTNIIGSASFSIICQINFLIYGVERWIKEETPTKLRFMYLLYYSLLELLPQINQKLNTAFKMDCSWNSRDFRNSMAHYKLGVALKKEELVIDDLLFGLTIKYFGGFLYRCKEGNNS